MTGVAGGPARRPPQARLIIVASSGLIHMGRSSFLCIKVSPNLASLIAVKATSTMSLRSSLLHCYPDRDNFISQRNCGSLAGKSDCPHLIPLHRQLKSPILETEPADRREYP